jgi:hypothetical protein
MDNGQTVHCLEVLHAVQIDSRTAGRYWGDVRGKAAAGAATSALRHKDLVCAGVGAPPFRRTPKGEAFLKTRQHPREVFRSNTDRPATLKHFALALAQPPEVHP